MDQDEGLRLHDVALEAAALGPCLEIGGYCGKSALYLGAAVKEKGGVLFSIDHHRGSEEQQPGEEYFDPELLDPVSGRIDTFRFFRQTLEAAGLEDTVVPIVSSSQAAARMWNGQLSLVFIDGGHAFETAYTDYASWACHLVPGGFLLFHDLFERPEDGGQAPYNVYKLALASGLFEELPRTKSLGVLKRGFDPKVLR
ncbi:MAG: class I SAM-dependent methyltransferase [Pseudomonadota bacterium]